MTDIKEKIILPSFFRLDIKVKTGDVELLECNVPCSQPAWLSNESGPGWLMQEKIDTDRKICISLKATTEAVVSFRFRAPDKRLNGLRIPIYCCYKQISLNGVQKLQCPIVSWHDRPYIIEALFNAGDTINLDFELASIEYTKDEFLTGMLLMSQDLIKSNLDTLIEALRKD